MSRIFIWLVSSSTLIVSERDPDEIVQTHMLSWAFAEVPRSTKCSRKEHTHGMRMIEMPSVLHAAWTYCRTGKSFKMLKREGRVGVSVG